MAAASGGWEKLFADHASAWADLWKSDVVVSGQPELQDWIRSNLYALQSSIRAGADDSIAPAGLSSDNYAGLIFWDAETWMFPSLLAFHPDVAQSVIDYRRKTIPGARTNATNLGHTASRRSTCRATSRSRSGSPTSPAATSTGCATTGRCCTATPSTSPAV
jgi:trehalose/maltose hydrolase-like predicted phosphorylase